ncbi:MULTISPECIES: U32 family peptidase [unclassified Ruegeria]|uniref:U32 family peptidase n=1 Tax=unclassified Ruegeria TaxID=2625375 RepID=UPI001487D9C9|nr:MULTISPECIES: U32 family peptidase [unclassified Ruegeria]NOD78634.1 peptidase U32 [Ruegeria sp. HKCCD4332]NOD90326.1 peptidase U32 [Ruegeria sp. HKCCD4318]NOE15398.1 peptidase U32 [Ruegeria sp. HKCCD4318-2]NOG10388.1 peptidase U32 [Ruegeria sp. HKCCD4315]
MTQSRSELLMPAGNLRKLKLAILYGADAVYLGTPDMSLRTKSEFSLDEVIEGIEFCHSHGRRAYLTLNLFSHNKDIPKLDEYIDTVRKVQPDGLIIADPGVFQYVRERAPELPLHISTQANICSWLSVKFWQDQGAELVVLAREVSYPELAEIREKCPDIKLEAFVHGAMCMTYSGRCLLSNFMAERGANQGNCANSCRWNYGLKLRLKDGTHQELRITDENADLFEFLLEEGCRPGDLMPIEEDDRGSYILNSRDLCIMPKLDEYLKIGVDSLKVEGRGKSEYYAAIVARAYRMAIDDYNADPENWDPKPYMRELETVGNRGYTLAFHEGRLTNFAHDYEHTASIAQWEYAGIVTEVTEDAFLVEVKNKLEPGDVLDFVSPISRDTVLLRVYDFERASDGKRLDVVHGSTKTAIRLPFTLFDHEDIDDLRARFPVYSVLRKERALTDEHWSRIRFDKLVQGLEATGRDNPTAYARRRDELVEKIGEDGNERRFKTNRIGTEGCCGKGCNGCLIFWQDEKYALAREVLSKRKQGEQLSRREATELKLPGEPA